MKLILIQILFFGQPGEILQCRSANDAISPGQWSGMTLTKAEPAPAPVSHAIWDGLLKKHVSAKGNVNYEGIKADRAKLKEYFGLLSKNHPADSWSKQEKMACWINVYNAYTIELILQNWPVKSIKDISNPWKQKIIKLGGKTYDLDHVEHQILRKMGDSRIHFAIVCASYSCPQLRNEAFTADKLNAQLIDQAKKFINDPNRNKISASALQLSKIFDWFKGDFTKKTGLISYINKYSKVKAGPKAKITYLKYDWALNK